MMKNDIDRKEKRDDFSCKMIDEDAYYNEIRAISDSIKKSINLISQYGLKFEETVRSVSMRLSKEKGSKNG